MTNPAAFQGTYSDFKLVRTRKVIQVVIEVPIEHANVVLMALNGMPRPDEEKWVAVALLDPEMAPKNEASTDHWMSRKAALLCKQMSFQTFISDVGPIVSNEEEAAGWLRELCGVASRSELIPGTPAGDSFERIVAEYENWMRGEDASPL